MRMKVPKGVTQFVTTGGVVYQVEDGHVEADNEQHIAEMMHPGHNFRHAPDSAEREDEIEAQFDGMTKADLIDWLEEHNVTPPDKAKRSELLALAEEEAAKGE